MNFDVTPLYLSLAMALLGSVIFLISSWVKANKFGLLFSSVLTSLILSIFFEYQFFALLSNNYSTLLWGYGEIVFIIIIPGLCLFATFGFLGNFFGSQILDGDNIMVSIRKGLKSMFQVSMVYLAFVILCGISFGMAYLLSTNTMFTDISNKYPVIGILYIIVAMLPFMILFGSLYYLSLKLFKSFSNSREPEISFVYESKSEMKKVVLEYTFDNFLL